MQLRELIKDQAIHDAAVHTAIMRILIAKGIVSEAEFHQQVARARAEVDQLAAAKKEEAEISIVAEHPAMAAIFQKFNEP